MKTMIHVRKNKDTKKQFFDRLTTLNITLWTNKEHGDHTDEEAALKKQLEENEKSMKAMQQSYEEKLAAAKATVSPSNFQVSIS